LTSWSKMLRILRGVKLWREQAEIDIVNKWWTMMRILTIKA